MRRKARRSSINIAVTLVVYGVYAALVIPAVSGSVRFLAALLLFPVVPLLLWLTLVQPHRMRPVLLTLSGLAVLCFIGLTVTLIFPRGTAVSMGKAVLKGNTRFNIPLVIAVIYIISMTIALFVITVVHKRKEH